jgi:Family of unknown function (DUF5681)
VPEKTIERTGNEPEKGSKSLTQARRQGNRWKPGQSGNPAGRPKGSRNKATLIAEQLLGGSGEEIVSKAIDMAKAGNPVALRLCIERLVPTRKGNVVEFELPRIEKAQDLAAAAAAVIEAAAQGKLSLAEARDFMHLLELQRSAIETVDLAIRIEVLEDSERERRRYKPRRRT